MSRAAFQSGCFFLTKAVSHGVLLFPQPIGADEVVL